MSSAGKLTNTVFAWYDQQPLWLRFLAMPIVLTICLFGILYLPLQIIRSTWRRPTEIDELQLGRHLKDVEALFDGHSQSSLDIQASEFLPQIRSSIESNRNDASSARALANQVHAAFRFHVGNWRFAELIELAESVAIWKEGDWQNTGGVQPHSEKNPYDPPGVA